MSAWWNYTKWVNFFIVSNVLHGIRFINKKKNCNYHRNGHHLKLSALRWSGWRNGTAIRNDWKWHPWLHARRWMARGDAQGPKVRVYWPRPADRTEEETASIRKKEFSSLLPWMGRRRGQLRSERQLVVAEARQFQSRKVKGHHLAPIGGTLGQSLADGRDWC